MKALITGSVGFIGYHVASRLLENGHAVAGFDGMVGAHDARLRAMRLARLTARQGYQHHVGMLEDRDALRQLFERFKPDIVIHLAGRAGIRESIENPDAFVSANMIGTFNLLELLSKHPVKHLLIASSSSVYGANAKTPFAEADLTDEPITVYAATKKSIEVMAHAYSHLWRIPTTVFRFFTVYGPYGRTNMAVYRFVDAIANNRPIDIYGTGAMCRDFTYVDDLVEAVDRLVTVAPHESNRVRTNGIIDTLSPGAPYRVVNVGAGNPASILELVDTIERALQKKASRNYLDLQMGDAPYTCASCDLLRALVGTVPDTTLAEGMKAVVDWYFAECYEGLGDPAERVRSLQIDDAV